MIPDDERAASLARRIADGDQVDWAAELLAAESPEERETLEAFRAIASLASLHRRDGDVPAPDRLVPGSTWGPLTIQHEIGRGQFGTVYLAWDPRLERQVALKLLDQRQSVGAGTAIREARLLARVRHPNVLTVHGAEEIDGRVGIWTEYIDGCTLEDEIATRGHLSPSEVVAIGSALCQALAAVHDAGLLHRDIKTQNVMRDRTGRIVLMDFGAGGDTVALASRDTVAGTPLYLAPELFDGSAPSVAADVYAAGVTLFRLLTGEFPVDGRTFHDVRVAHEERGPAAVTAVAPHVPAPLAAAIDRALARNPRDRFADARSFERELSSTPGGGSGYRDSASAGWSESLWSIRIAGAGLVSIIVAAVIAYGVWRRSRPADMPRPETVAAPTIVVRQVLPGIAPDLPSNPSMVRPTIARLDPSTADLVLTDLATGDTARLHVKDDGPGRPGLPGQSTLNRDGTRLAFAWEQDNVSGLRILDIAGHHISELSRRSEETILPFQWSADGRSVAALVLGKGGRARAVLFAADNGAERTIKTFTDVPLTISLSPDGHWLAYDKPSTDDPAHRDVGIVNTDSGIERTIVDHPADDLFPEWTPGGDALIFASSRTGTLGLWMLPVQNGGVAGEPRLVKDDIGRMWPLGFTSADTMYFTARSGYVDVFTAALGADGTVAAKPAAVSRRIVGSNISPAWSADGQRLAYVSELREGGDRQSRALVIRDLATDEEQLLIPDLRFFIGPRWSADGTTVMVKGADGTGRSGLHAVHLSDSRTEPLLLDTTIGQYGWGAAGQIYYVVRDRIMVHRLRDGSRADADTVLLDTDTQGITRLATSPVSGALAYSAITRGNGSARSVLRVHDAAGDRELFSTSLPETIACESWSPDGRLILFSTIREPNAPELFAIGTDGGEARRLGLQMDGLREVSVNAAGRLAFTGGWPSRSLWAIEHLPQPNP